MTGYVPVDLRREIRALFQERCAYCHTFERLTVTVFEIEHIQPKAAGGETVSSNLCLACPACNRFKSSRIEAPDPLTQEPTPLFHPQRQEWPDHFRWADNGARVEPLTAVGRATAAALRFNRPQMIRLRQLWIKMGEHPPEPLA